LTLTAYTDANWERSINDRKRISGGEFFLGKSLVSSLSKNKPFISLSTTKFEYITTSSYYSQVIWMKQTLEDLQVKYDHPILLNYDNTSAINFFKNHVMH
jgi:hypothetical protein